MGTDYVNGPTSRAFTMKTDAKISYGNRREITLSLDQMHCYKVRKLLCLGNVNSPTSQAVLMKTDAKISDTTGQEISLSIKYIVPGPGNDKVWEMLTAPLTESL